VIKVMKDKTGEGIHFQVPRFARTKEVPSTEPFNWSIINLSISIFILTYQMQGRFKIKMEYRLFTIVQYNYKDYNTPPSKPNMHARLKTMQRETSTKTKQTSGRQQDSKNFFEIT
jgi:hypothetical protein